MTPPLDLSALLARHGARGSVEEDYGIQIAADGTWIHHGSPIGRAALVRLFASVLHKDQAGDYWLVTPAERGRIAVADAPFVVVEAEIGDGLIRLRTNVDDWVTLDADHPLRIAEDQATGEPRPYVTVRDGIEARIDRAVYYHLIAAADQIAQPDGTIEVGLWSAQHFFPLGRY